MIKYIYGNNIMLVVITLADALVNFLYTTAIKMWVGFCLLFYMPLYLNTYSVVV